MPEWEKRGACYRSDVPFHYDQAGYNVEVCREICAGCPVQRECLSAVMAYEAAMGGHYRYGFWANTTPTERQRLTLEVEEYAVYPDEMTELEVVTIFQGMVEQMETVVFVHKVDEFEPGEEVLLGDDLVAKYVPGHARIVAARVDSDDEE